MRVVLFVLLLSFPYHSFAQDVMLQGRVVDEQDSKPIENVVLTGKYEGKTYTAKSDSLGMYFMSVPKGARFVLKATHINYHSLSKLINSDNTLKIDYALVSKSRQLKEAVVTANAKRVEQRNDTTVYFANAYKVNTDATAYDLITQKLPGIGIRDGKIEAQGESVKEILLDGKEFFKSDLILSLKNLPAEIIDEIQLFDKVSDYSLLTGFDDGTRKKTINIVTKKGMSDNLFGKAYGGYGWDNYYKLYGMFNFFQDDKRFSLFAQDNNVSEQNFSMIDLLSTTGTAMNTAPQQSPYSKGTSDNTFHPAVSDDVSDMMVGGYSAGETKSHAIGGNFSDVWGKKDALSFSGHYLFNKAENDTEYEIRDDYFNEGAHANLQNQKVLTDNTNHRFNTKIDWKINADNHIMIRPSVLYQQKNETSALKIFEEDPISLDLFDLMSQKQKTNQEAVNTSNEIMYIHRFRHVGSSLSMNMKLSYENTEESVNLSHKVTKGDSSVQTTWSENNSMNIASVGSYIHPLGRYFRLKTDIGWSVTYRDIKRKTERLEHLSQMMALDSVLSGKTSSDYGGFLSGISMLYGRRNTQVVVGAEYHSYRFYSKNDITENQHSSNAILPYIHLRHQWGSNNCQLHFQYKTEQTFPSTQQLQDAINNTSPTLSIRGNIGLKPSYSHTASLRLLVPTKDDGGIFVFFVNAETIKDYIANKRSIAGGALGAAESRSQMLSYTNTNGYYSTSSLVAYGFPFNPIRSNINISSLIRYSHIPGYWESAKSYNKQINWNSSFTIGSNISKQLDFVLDCNLQYLKDKNESHPLIGVSYWSLSYGGQVNWQFYKSLKVVLECGRTEYYGLGTDKMDAVIFNMALAYKFLKGQRGELRISCDDILDQNNYFAQQTNELFRRKTTANVLGRHALLTFTYKFNVNDNKN